VDGPEIKQLAVYVKGNPKLHKLGASLAEYVSERERARDTIEAAHELGRNVGVWMFMPKIIIPVGDDAGRRTVPGVTFGIILINAIVLAWMYYSPLGFPAIFSTYGFIPQRIMAGEAVFTFISSMFLHAGLFHLLANSFFLWIFADNVEDVFGHILFIAFYLACGVCASLAFLLVHAGSEVPGLGASGAVSGIMGAYFVFHPHARLKTFVFFTVITIPAYLYLGLWFGAQLLYTSLYRAMEPVGFSAHSGGFAAGITLAMLHKAVTGRKRA
jgi:membrane associated rhomboid family serine protease